MCANYIEFASPAKAAEPSPAITLTAVLKFFESLQKLTQNESFRRDCLYLLEAVVGSLAEYLQTQKSPPTLLKHQEQFAVDLSAAAKKLVDEMNLHASQRLAAVIMPLSIAARGPSQRPACHV